METELKLSLSAPELPRLLAHPLLAQTGDTQRLLNTYFDTPELALQQRRMAVRERLAGEQWLLTVKTAGQSTGGLSRRQEWEGPTTPGALQFDTLVEDAALAQDLMALRPNLRALFCTDFERQRWVIEHAGNGLAERLGGGLADRRGARKPTQPLQDQSMAFDLTDRQRCPLRFQRHHALN